MSGIQGDPATIGPKVFVRFQDFWEPEPDTGTFLEKQTDLLFPDRSWFYEQDFDLDMIFPQPVDILPTESGFVPKTVCEIPQQFGNSERAKKKPAGRRSRMIVWIPNPTYSVSHLFSFFQKVFYSDCPPLFIFSSRTLQIFHPFEDNFYAVIFKPIFPPPTHGGQMIQCQKVGF